MSNHDDESSGAPGSTPAATPASTPSGDPNLDVALTDMALALRQLVQTLKSSKIEDSRLDRCEDTLNKLIQRVPNA